MRLVGTVLFVALAGSVAFAEDAKPSEPTPEPAAPAVRAKVPLRVVRVLPDTHQALLFDKERGTHVLAEVGGTVEGFKVEDIDDDEVTLEGATGEVVLTAPPMWRQGDNRDDRRPSRHEARAERREARAEVKAEPQPEDPYADPAVRAVEAPVKDNEVRAVEAPVVEPSAIEPSPPPTPVAAPAPTPVVTPTPVAATPVAAPPPALEIDDPPTLTMIPRTELRAALANFGKLASAFHGGFVATGVKVDSVAEGSLFARVGLHAGDVVRAVDNLPLRSLDDAADLFARAGTARNITIQVVRGGKPLTLRVAIQ